MDIDFIDLIQKRNEIRKEWWGYNQTYGWVYLDRNFQINESGKSKASTYLFTRCSDWEIYEDLVSNWIAPNYIYGIPYLRNLSNQNLEIANRELYRIFSDYKVKKPHIKENLLKKEEELILKNLQILHNQYLKSKGIQSKAIIKSTQSSRRISHCWNCLSKVDNNTDYECTGCGWIVCGSCGACKKPSCNNIKA